MCTLSKSRAGAALSHDRSGAIGKGLQVWCIGREASGVVLLRVLAIGRRGVFLWWRFPLRLMRLRLNHLLRNSDAGKD